ncbi:hypothetical protein OEZ85_006231 [Tetradesmus obliquus]|uniref:Uncharacterized protein n=1 Tax=Tetradesmus obliquus TaxID=3088 RepID=A0ABY8TW80_TETOB|nr:hypothetical protein OEZ85_006231 [Tetradesmus obliquus]
MTSATDILARLQQLAQDDNLFTPIDINKGLASMKRDLQATHKRVAERKQAEAQLAQRRAAEAAAMSEDELAGEAAADASEDPAAKEAEMKAIQQQVEDALQEDAEAVGPEPPSHVTAIHPTQALPTLQLQGLPPLQKLLQLPQELLGAEAGSSSSNEAAEARAAEAFTWLLGQRQQLLVCPGGEVPDVSEAPWFAADSSAADASLLCGAPAFADQQPPVTLQWLPSPEDFLQALTAMGCRMPAPAAAAATTTPGGRRQQGRSSAAAADADAAVSGPAGMVQGCYADANLALLLALLQHVCRLGAQGRLRFKLGGGAAPKQLALLLMALMLDPRAAGSAAARGVLQGALAALLAAADDLEWRRLQGQLVEALTPPGFGPSNRSTVLLLSLLPLTERCVSVRQQAALKLLAALLPARKQQQQLQQAKAQAWPAVQRELLQLLGSHPDKALTQSLARPSSSAGSSKKQQRQAGGQVDIWALLDILDAANLLLWADLVRPEYAGQGSGGVPGEARAWFGGWMEKLERQVGKELRFYRLRSRLTELRNAYEFGSALGAAFDSGSGDSEDE